MTDEAIPSAAPETAVAPEAVEQPATEPTATPEATPAAETPSWQTELEKADAKDLRKNPKIAGIIGAEMQKAIAAERQRIQEEEGQRAAQAAEQKLRQLAQEDPVSFSEQWLSEAQKRDMQDQLEGLRGRTRHEFAQNVGKAVTTLPEWAELTEADHETLAKAVSGVAEDEVIPRFMKQATELVAKRMAQKQFDAWKAKELGKEREALRQEEAASLLHNSEAPDLTRPKGLPGNLNIGLMSNKDFDSFSPPDESVEEMTRRLSRR